MDHCVWLGGSKRERASLLMMKMNRGQEDEDVGRRFQWLRDWVGLRGGMEARTL